MNKIVLCTEPCGTPFSEVDHIKLEAADNQTNGELKTVVTGAKNLEIRQLAFNGGYLYEFGEYTLLGDDLVHQFLRSAFKDVPNVRMLIRA